jgi:hypothetical protein
LATTVPNWSMRETVNSLVSMLAAPLREIDSLNVP